VVTTETAERLLDDLIGTYLAGLTGRPRGGAANGNDEPPPGSA
jgi:hypothetical protein